MNYYRSGAGSPSISLTYQQLLDLLEREIEYRRIDSSKLRIPPLSSGDFLLLVDRIEEDGVYVRVVESVTSIKRLDDRRVDEGVYQFSHDMANGRKSSKLSWHAQVSVNAALWIVQRYIEKFLVDRRFTDSTTHDVVISKKSMYGILSVLAKRIAP